jgi:hypothetical protein
MNGCERLGGEPPLDGRSRIDVKRDMLGLGLPDSCEPGMITMRSQPANLCPENEELAPALLPRS